MDEKFTAQMEDDLDKVEEGEKSWVEVLEEFYKDFSKTMEKAEEDMKDVRMKIPDEETDIVCEKCGRNMVIKTGRYGKFLACPGFPECRNTKRIAVEMPGECPLCGGKILEKKSKKGKFSMAASIIPPARSCPGTLPLMRNARSAAKPC